MMKIRNSELGIRNCVQEIRKDVFRGRRISSK